jgi:hypothetical protein
MKNIILIIVLLSFSNLFSQTPVNDQNWIIHFEDNFNDSILNRNYWAHCPPWGECDNSAKLTNPPPDPWAVPGELNHILSNGILDLVSKKDSAVCRTFQNPEPHLYDTMKYTAGHILSKNPFKYGYFEIRCKIPQPNPQEEIICKGLSPTFWLYPLFDYYYEDGVTYSEIDIFEIDAENNLFTFNVHYGDEIIDIGTITPTWSLSERELGVDYDGEGNIHSKFYNPVDFSDNGIPDSGYHKFGCEWTPNYISFYLDDILVYTTNMKYKHNGIDYQYTDNLAYMHIWIGTATHAGNFGKQIDTVLTLLPYNYSIDYVRVYKLLHNCIEDYYSSSGYSDFVHSVKQNIILSHPIPSGQNYSFRATQEVILSDGFEVDENSSIYINNSDCE